MLSTHTQYKLVRTMLRTPLEKNYETGLDLYHRRAQQQPEPAPKYTRYALPPTTIIIITISSAKNRVPPGIIIYQSAWHGQAERAAYCIGSYFFFLFSACPSAPPAAWFRSSRCTLHTTENMLVYVFPRNNPRGARGAPRRYHVLRIICYDG